MNNKKHIIPTVIEYSLETEERKILKYVELTDKQYDEQIIKPFAKALYEIMQSEIKSGKFKPGEHPNKNTNE